MPVKERCIRGSPKPGNDTESARNGGRGGQFLLNKWKSLAIRLSYAIFFMSTYVIFCTCLLFLNLSHNVTPPLNPNAIELVEDVSIMFSIFCCLCTEFFAFGVPTMQTLEANDLCGQVIQIARAAICQREFLCQIKKHVLRIVSQLEKYEQVWRHIRNLDKC